MSPQTSKFKQSTEKEYISNKYAEDKDIKVNICLHMYIYTNIHILHTYKLIYKQGYEGI